MLFCPDWEREAEAAGVDKDRRQQPFSIFTLVHGGRDHRHTLLSATRTCHPDGIMLIRQITEGHGTWRPELRENPGDEDPGATTSVKLLGIQ